MSRNGETSDEFTDIGKAVMREIGVMEKKPVVKTGFPTSTFEAGRSEGGMTQGEIAVINQYGSETTPPRPFMTIAYEENKTEMRNKIAELLVKIGEGKMTTREALDRIGVIHVGQIRQTISSNVPPPNDPDTIMRKLRKSGFKVVPGATEGGKDASSAVTTLIDTGQMRQNVNHEVKMNGAGND